MSLAETLGLGDRELVSFVGAGGKKTAIRRLVDEARHRDLEAAYTTTTHTPPPDGIPLRLTGTTDRPSDLSDIPSPVALAQRRVDDPERATEKVRGFDPDVVDSFFEDAPFNWVLVKADGARRREFKAPGPNEPQVPAESTIVVTVASARVIGRPLAETDVHRVERVADLTDLAVGDELTTAAVGRVLAHPDSGRKRVPATATAVPLVNKADTAPQQRAARDAVRTALESTDRFKFGIVAALERGHLEIVR